MAIQLLDNNTEDHEFLNKRKFILMQNNKVQLPTQLGKRMAFATKISHMPTTHVTPTDKIRKSLLDFRDSQETRSDNSRSDNSRSDNSRSLTKSNSRSTTSQSQTSSASQNSTSSFRTGRQPPTQE